MANRQSHRGQALKICCYQIDPFDQDRPLIRVANGPMISRDESSKIKFAQVNISREPSYRLLSHLYQDNGNNSNRVQQTIKQLFFKRVNPIILENVQNLQRDDLEFYVPQIVTYMVIQCNLSFSKFNQLVLEACMTDFYFAHSVFFYLESLASTQEGDVKIVRNFINEQFLPRMTMYQKVRLSGCQLAKCRLSVIHQEQRKSINQQRQVQEFFRLDQNNKEKNVAIVFNRDYCQSGFLATPKFWRDLVKVGEDITKCMPNQKSAILQQLIEKRIKPNLPAAVYVPFFKNHIRLYTVLSIKKGFLFSTKQRSPYSIYLELYREQQQRAAQQEKFMIRTEQQKQKDKKNILYKIFDTISAPFTPGQGKNTLNLKKILKQKTKQEDQQVKRRTRVKSFYQENQQSEQFKKPRKVSLSFVYDANSQGVGSSIQSQNSIRQYDDKDQLNKQVSKQGNQNQFFSKKFYQTQKQIKQKSPYKHLKSWKLLHLMVKIGDDLKQESFAMQLINRFQYIFKKQNVDLFLMPYEVVSLGPDFGLIEMINDVTTLDSLFRKLALEKKTLDDIFKTEFKDRQTARRNFMKSLAAYSVVTYFLQVKDRHNGNILLHRDGYIIHIDFGFLLSNAPGRGVELQKKVPFKLLTQYVEVLGSINSELFFDFRRLFLKGFRAVIKNRQIIISLVKMMYLAHGDTMACFKRGEQTIQDLQLRLNPPRNLDAFCYDLINNSLDNWRARWYDKFQYFLQKIYY